MKVTSAFMLYKIIEINRIQHFIDIKMTKTFIVYETVNSALQSKLDRGKILAPQKFHPRLCRKNVSTSHIRELWINAIKE